MRNALIIAAVLVAGFALARPRLAGARYWRATITPLASIIGSGFLVLGPILLAAYGLYAPLVMLALCAGAYAFGTAIRFNIARIETLGAVARSSAEERLESVASWSLAFSYIVSVAYYVNLFGAFGVSLTPFNDPLHAKLLTSALLLLILAVGWTRGFKALERMEQITVGAKLAIIAGLLVGLALYFAGKAGAGTLLVNPAKDVGWSAVALAFGLIVTVQGFETARYLGANYDAATRIRSMRLAQWLSTAIYLLYITFFSFVFSSVGLRVQETAIVEMMRVVAPILPLLLVAAALSAQFSAAVADTSGAGGLFHELTGKRMTPRQGYALLVGVGVLLTWTANVFQIINYASRAFALYYGLQAVIAAIGAAQPGTEESSTTDPASRWRIAGFGLLGLLGGLIVVFGAAVEA